MVWKLIDSSKRIRIIGAPGSRKDLLAEKISDNTNIPLVHLDDILWEEKISKVLNKKIVLLDSILRHEEWLLEGSLIDRLKEKTLVDSTLIIVLKSFFIKNLFFLMIKFIRNLSSKKDVKNNYSFKRFIFDVNLAFHYRTQLKNLLDSKHFTNKIVVFNSADKAYSFFVKENTPDLFM